MSDTCSNCKFWNFWSTVALVDDGPRALGHCVVDEPDLFAVQGLTAEDFWCIYYRPAVEPVTEKVDG